MSICVSKGGIFRNLKISDWGRVVYAASWDSCVVRVNLQIQNDWVDHWMTNHLRYDNHLYNAMYISYMGWGYHENFITLMLVLWYISYTDLLAIILIIATLMINYCNNCELQIWTIMTWQIWPDINLKHSGKLTVPENQLQIGQDFNLVLFSLILDFL